MTNIQIDFPDENDTLIKTKADFYSSALGANWQDLSWYSHSFELSLEILIKHIKKNVKHGQLLTLPILFLSRHFIELKLKEIINYFDKSKLYTNHGLKDLWETIVSNMKSEYAFEKTEINELNNTGKLIFELDEIDKGSFNFRYPTNKKGKKSLEFAQFDLNNFVTVIEKVNNYLGSLRDFCQNN